MKTLRHPDSAERSSDGRLPRKEPTNSAEWLPLQDRRILLRREDVEIYASYSLLACVDENTAENEDNDDSENRAND